MARLESIAVGGHFKTPTHLLPRIAKLAAPYHGTGEITLLDPCAGEGEAILALCKSWGMAKTPNIYACEMEETRATAFKLKCSQEKWTLGRNLIHGDAFRVAFDKGYKEGASVLFLNPPYDLDRTYGRLEHKFLVRFTPALMLNGILVLVVPHYALTASAEYLASEYRNLHCFKFPDEDFSVYKQVVLFGQRSGSTAPDQELVKRITQWVADPQSLPELPNITSAPLCEIPSSVSHKDGFQEWVLRPADMTSLLAKVKPWTQSQRNGSSSSVSSVVPDLPLEEMLLRKYPLVVPPRPAHIAAGIASGIFNGSRVDPNDSTLGLPPLLVKGVFNQEWRTVEEKTNKKGEVTSIVQVQQPQLVATVLDLSTYRYHTLTGSSEEPQVDKLSVAGLLRHYGDSLMAVMETQCPVLYDPRKDGDKVPLPQTARNLFTAQSHATKALIVKLGGPNVPLRKRKGKGAILLGEIGSGKTTVASALAKAIGSKRPLVMCPPHLLDSWRDEVAAVLPEASYRVLETVSDLEAVSKDTREGMLVSIVSRETAKLSHSWIGVGPVCPKCGAVSRVEREDQAKQRLRCSALSRDLSGPIAALSLKLANQLVRYAPGDLTIQTLLFNRWGRKRIRFYKQKKAPPFPGFNSSYFDSVLDVLAETANPESFKAILWILYCLNDEERIVRFVDRFSSSDDYRSQEFGRGLLLLLKPSSQTQLALYAKYKEANRSYYNSWNYLPDNIASAVQGDSHHKVAELQISWKDGVLVVDQKPHGIASAQEALRSLYQVSGIKLAEEPCGEMLYQAVPEPRRVALAQHITQRYPNTFDFLVLDEVHEYGNDNSAQSRSAHRLTNLKLPTLEMTGSIMNGYAESMFTNMWSISEDFRQEFQREDKIKFVERYGYRKRLVSDQDAEGEVVSFGSNSDKVTRSSRIIGNAPGVLPLFLLRHLLPHAVTLHKDDLALDLPICTQEKVLIQPTQEVLSRFEVLRQALVSRIKEDQFDPELAGKLFGQLAELPSFFDRTTADTGNTTSGDYSIRYPDSVGGEVIAQQAAFPASTVSPKEEWMLDRIEAELAEGRNVLVFSWHVALMPRLARLITERIGDKVPILHSDKVSTGKRQEWITKQVVNKGARILLANPVAVQTGLNNLVHFATEIWMENPACNPIVFRQAIGRIDRIGQKLATRIFCPLYAGTPQELLYDLLLQKVAISVSTDGLDPESALLAAGIGAEEFMSGLSIGKQIWALWSEGFTGHPAKSQPWSEASFAA